MPKLIVLLFIVFILSACSLNNKNIAQNKSSNVFDCPKTIHAYIDSYYDQDENLVSQKFYKATFDDKLEYIGLSELNDWQKVCAKQTKFFAKDSYFGEYNLIAPLDIRKIFLMDMDGNVVRSWDTQFLAANDISLTPDGKFLGLFNNGENIFEPMAGQGGTTQIINQSGQLEWNFDYYSEQYTTHHDVEFLPNGNILMLVWNSYSLADSMAKGFVPLEDIEYSSGVWFEKIIEVNPETDEIVWSWDSFDHSGSAYNMIDISDKAKERKPGDIMHANGLAYDSDRDLIFVTVNGFSEVWAIDHSTSIEEAASDEGGNYGAGGRLVYRFGSDFLNAVHNPSVLENGNIMIFSNGQRGQENALSTIYELKLPDYLSYYDKPEIVWSFSHPDLYSPYISGAQRLPNGNTLIAEGDFGLWEVNSDSQVVWQYAYHPKYPDNAKFGAIWAPYRYSQDDFDF